MRELKKLLPIIVVLVVIAAGAYFLTQKKSQSLPGGESETFSGTLQSAIALGVPLKCSYTVEGNEYEGLVKGENYRGKIKSAQGQISEVIVKDNCIWTWSESEAQGIKTCVEESEVETESGDIWSQSEAAGTADVTYTCLPAAVDDTQFEPPAGIEFTDLNSMLQQYGY